MGGDWSEFMATTDQITHEIAMIVMDRLRAAGLDGYLMPADDVRILVSFLDHYAFGYTQRGVDANDAVRRMMAWLDAHG